MMAMSAVAYSRDGSAKATLLNGVLRTTTVATPFSETVFEGPDGEASARWRRTERDFLGRAVSETRPAYGGGLLVTSNAYDSAGRVVETTSLHVPESGAPRILSRTLHAYDALGGRVLTAEDRDLDGAIGWDGIDTVSSNDTRYVQLGGDWWREARAWSAGRDGAPGLALETTTRSRVTGLGGGLAAESVAIDAQGGTTTNRVWRDRDEAAETRWTLRPESEIPAAVLSTNGLAYVVGSATGVTNHYAYDALGRRVAETDGRGNTTRTAYDALGRVSSVTDAAGFATTFAYDALGRQVASTDPLGNVTHTSYDSEGRVVARWGATYPVFYAYDAFGDLATLTTFRDAAAPLSPERGDTTRWLRDAATGLVTNKLYADGLGPSYTYTPDGKLATRTWARGIVTEYSYDLNGSLTNVVYSDGTPSIAYAYDNRGNLITATVDGVSTNFYAYDVFGNITNEVQNGTVISRDYDAFGRPTGYALGSGGAGGSPAEPDATVAYSYDPFGRFVSVSAGGSGDVPRPLPTFAYSYLPGTDLVSGYTCGSFSRSVSYEPHRDLIAAVTNTFNAFNDFNV